MRRALNSFWKDPVWSTVIAAAIVAVAGLILTSVLDLWESVASALSSSAQYAAGTAPVPRWLFAVLILLAAPTVIVTAVGLWTVVRRDAVAKPTWRSYKTDLFQGIRWRWGYRENGISDLLPFCPKCDYQLAPDETRQYGGIRDTVFRCDLCTEVVAAVDEPYSELKGKIERFIHQKIRTNAWSAEGQPPGA
jgi:hypothetical protein